MAELAIETELELDVCVYIYEQSRDDLGHRPIDRDRTCMRAHAARSTARMRAMSDLHYVIHASKFRVVQLHC